MYISHFMIFVLICFCLFLKFQTDNCGKFDYILIIFTPSIQTIPSNYQQILLPPSCLHFYNPLNPLPAALMCMGMRPSIRTCTSYQYPHPWKENASLKPRAQQSSTANTFSARSEATHAGMLTDSVLCRSYAGNRGCCKFMGAAATHVQKTTFHSASPHRPALTFLHLLFHNAPWDLLREMGYSISIMLLFLTINKRC